MLGPLRPGRFLLVAEVARLRAERFPKSGDFGYQPPDAKQTGCRHGTPFARGDGRRCGVGRTNPPVFRDVWATVDGRRVYARVCADAPAGAVPVVLVHGLGVSGRYMLP